MLVCIDSKSKEDIKRMFSSGHPRVRLGFCFTTLSRIHALIQNEFNSFHQIGTNPLSVLSDLKFFFIEGERERYREGERGEREEREERERVRRERVEGYISI